MQNVFVTNNPALTLPTGTALLANRVVAFNATTFVADYCGPTDVPIGQTVREVAAGFPQTVRMLSAGTHEFCASGAITRGAAVYPDTNGKITATPVAGAHCIGMALATAGGDGEIIGVLPTAMLAQVIQDLAAATSATALTDSTGGTPSTTLAAITAGAGYAQADAVATKNALASLAADNNKLRADLVDMRAKLVASGLFLT